jgi:hypothetical protein
MKRPFLILAALLLALRADLHAELGLPREAYGVWDRSGFNPVAQYPFTRGQSSAASEQPPAPPWSNSTSCRERFCQLINFPPNHPPLRLHQP